MRSPAALLDQLTAPVSEEMRGSSLTATAAAKPTPNLPTAVSLRAGPSLAGGTQRGQRRDARRVQWRPYVRCHERSGAQRQPQPASHSPRAPPRRPRFAPAPPRRGPGSRRARSPPPRWRPHGTARATPPRRRAPERRSSAVPNGSDWLSCTAWIRLPSRCPHTRIVPQNPVPASPVLTGPQSRATPRPVTAHPNTAANVTAPHQQALSPAGPDTGRADHPAWVR